ncbi:ANTH-domain-containing protein [Coprinellus micaceus]|uniref:ANTH-domain-containing protein n=1 Tax=Coprinellus micaceus TaxID=71717 RepID=A0A4Y7TRC1_COPMI|nr:ANTH-domain-containing protein [Coprinellus micaceus]
MSSFDKIVKLACKPKAASPKAKYIDPIIAATWSDDGAVSDVCKALVPRIREPNVIIVFKALIVLHTMIRNGSTDNVLGYLSQTDILRLKNVAAVNWEGYAAPENLQHYSLYLDARIRAYRDLKHDAIKVQSDTNRDMRSSMAFDEEGTSSSAKGGKRGRRGRDDPAPTSAPTRSKTIMGRKLRVMTVEKGLLRETKIVHGMIDALVECRFYLDDLEDELNIQALSMLVKDLLILFQAGNEGVINLLEHYFEMSHIDAEDALKIYRHFCSQTEKVVEFLGVARKLQNLLNVPIPNLKHAPVSLAGALQEYLDDPNFEDNRLEYRENKKASENSARRSSDKDGKDKKSSVTFKEPSQAGSSSGTSSSTSAAANGQNGQKKEVIDFFSAIEEEQQSMFQSPPHSASQPQFTINPFSQMMTGQPFAQAPQIAVQNTGFLVPQQTAFQVPGAPNPFNNMLGAQQLVQAQATGHRPFSAFIPTQATGMPFQQTGLPQQVQQSQSVGVLQQPGAFQQPQQTGFLAPQQTSFLQPQTTGSNPFRQSMLMPQSTGSQLFNTNPAGATLGQNLFVQSKGASAPNSASPFSATTSFSTFQPQAQPSTSSFASLGGNSAPGNSVASPPFEVPNRPQSTPLASANNFQPLQQVKTHQTGTKNPFGPVITPVPPVPKPPTLFELSMGMQGANANGAANQQPQQPQPTGAPSQPSTNMGGFNFASSALNPGPTDMSGIASSFTSLSLGTNGTTSPSQNPSAAPLHPQHTVTPSNASSASSSFFSSALSSQATGATSVSSGSSSFSNPLTSQPTGFAGLKPFKPSSSFGASLLDSIPASNPTSPQATNPPAHSLQPQHTITPGSAFSTPSFTSSFLSKTTTTTTANPTGALNSQPTGFSGSSNAPSGLFGASGLPSQPTGVPGLPSNTPSSTSSPLASQPTGTTRAFTPSSNFGMSLSAQATGATGPFAGSTTPSFSPQQTGGPGGTSTLGVGLRPQLTGGGAANPFRASMATNSPAFGASGTPPVPAIPSIFQTGQQAQGQQQPFGGMQFGTSGPFAGMMGQQGQQQQGQQQQQQSLF